MQVDPRIQEAALALVGAYLEAHSERVRFRSATQYAGMPAKQLEATIDDDNAGHLTLKSKPGGETILTLDVTALATFSGRAGN